MTKQLFFISAISISLLASSLAACSSGSNSSTASSSGDISDFPVRLNYKSFSRQFFCSDDDSSDVDATRIYTKASASVQWPEQIGAVDISQLCDSIISIVNYNSTAEINSSHINPVIANYVNNPEEAEYFSLQPVDSIPYSDDLTRAYSHSLDISFSSLTRRLAIIKTEHYAYTGGAHGIYASSYMIFSLADGIARHLAFSDLFLPDSSHKLLEAITSALMHKYGVDTPSDLDSVGIFTDNLHVSTDIYISDYDIIFHYDPYDIGPWAMGIIDVPIPYYNISEFLTPTALSLFTD